MPHTLMMWTDQPINENLINVPEDPKGIMAIGLTRADLVTLNNALNEVLHGPEAIPEWEFQTRIGVQPSQARVLRKTLSGMLELGGAGIA